MTRDEKVRRFIDEFLTIPQGFTKEEDLEWPDKIWMSGPSLTLRSSEEEIEFIFRFSEFENILSITGTTRFKSAGVWYSFDRIGVDSSFYLAEDGDWEEPFEKVNEVLKKQFERIAQSRERLERSKPVPGIGFMLTPERIEKISRTLKAGGTETLMPSGFGTGYQLIGKKVRAGQWGPQIASKALKDFFKVPVLYVQSFDAD